MERRRRICRPYSLWLFFGILLLWPVINYAGYSYNFNVSLSSIIWVLLALKPWEVFLLFIPWFIAPGIILVKKWAWYAFLVYGVTVVLYDIVAFSLNPGWYNLSAIAQAALAFAAMVFLVHKDISAPYFHLFPRGWRFEKRSPMRIDLSINDELCQTLDFSPAGFFASNSQQLRLNEGVVVHIPALAKEFQAGVVRMDKSGYGFAFRGLRKSEKNLIRNFIKCD